MDAPDTFDLEEARAARAARSDAQREPFTFCIGKDKFTVPHLADWPVDVFPLLDDKEWARAMKQLVGDEDWPRLAVHRLSRDDVSDILDAATAAAGMGTAGKSSASGDSSRGTTTPSSPTSSTGESTS